MIKNWIFKNYSQIHPNDNAKDIWNEIRKCIAEFSDLETFFRHYWNSKYAFASDDRLYKSFKDFLKKGAVGDARTFLIELREASEVYRKIGIPRETDWPVQKEKAARRALELLNQYRVTQVRPFLLALLECRAKRLVDQTTFLATIKNLENFHFIFSNLCQDRASGLEGKYTRAAKNLHLAGSDKVEIKKVIFDLKTYLEKKRPNSQRIIDALGGLNFLSGEDTNKKTIQTVFLKVEQHLHGTSELFVGGFSLEHVRDQATKSDWVGSLGNIIPLDEDLNNKIKENSTFLKKKIQYEKSSFKTVAHFLELNKQTEWSRNDSTRWLDYVGKLLDSATMLK